MNVQNQNCKHSSINSSSFSYNCIKHPRFARTVQIAVNQLEYSYGYSVKEILCKLRYDWNTILRLRYIKKNPTFSGVDNSFIKYKASICSSSVALCWNDFRNSSNNTFCPSSAKFNAFHGSFPFYQGAILQHVATFFQLLADLSPYTQNMQTNNRN